jgi:hypothetical protein
LWAHAGSSEKLREVQGKIVNEKIGEMIAEGLGGDWEARCGFGSWDIMRRVWRIGRVEGRERWEDSCVICKWSYA